VVRPVLDYIRKRREEGRWVVVLVPSIVPSHLRYRMLHNQRDLLLTFALQRQTDAVVCLLPIRVGE